MALDKVKDDMLQDNLVFPGSTAQFPSITTAQRNALSSVQPGTLIYNSDVKKLQQYDGNNTWATIDSPPVITGVTYPTESGAVLTALDASGGTDAAQTLIINGSNFSETSGVTVQIQVSGSYVAFASSVSVNGAGNQITCTGVTKRAAADGYVIKVTNASGLAATTTVNFSADPAFSTAASLGSVFAASTLSKSIAFTGTKVIQGATAKPTWMSVTGATSTANNGTTTAPYQTFDATGTPIVLGGTVPSPDSGNSQTFTFSIIVRDAENQTFNRDYSLSVATLPASTGTASVTNYTNSGVQYRVYVWNGNGSFTPAANLSVDFLVLAGGGGGASGDIGKGGGGGAGGFRQSWNNETSGGGASSESALSLIGGVAYTITVGGGGARSAQGATQGNDGVNSSIVGGSGGTAINLISLKGGGGSFDAVGRGGSGSYGSGGGAGGQVVYAGGVATAGQGYAGGTSAVYGGGASYGTAGGGGAGAIGGSGVTNTATGGAGGAGASSTIISAGTASAVFYAGGGGGFGSSAGGAGGNGGGTQGGINGSTTVANVAANTGGGGGAGSQTSGSQQGGAGGSGKVILCFPIG